MILFQIVKHFSPTLKKIKIHLLKKKREIIAKSFKKLEQLLPLLRQLMHLKQLWTRTGQHRFSKEQNSPIRTKLLLRLKLLKAQSELNSQRADVKI
ncbi:MAG: hypothetical protein COA94_08280 [Rickettsiales bacterium]|nr:MAG: hypothetical protein COA94_08280 [Rickettsiales bacterium]